MGAFNRSFLPPRRSFLPPRGCLACRCFELPLGGVGQFKCVYSPLKARVGSFLLLSWRYSSLTIKFTLLKCASLRFYFAHRSVPPSPPSILEHFHHPRKKKKKPYSISSHVLLPRLSPTAPGNHELILFLTTLDILHKWNRAICCLLCLAPYT